MTEDERLINETWPLIRETVSHYRPIIESMGYTKHIQRRSLRDQLRFWLDLKWMNEHRLPDIEEIARNTEQR